MVEFLAAHRGVERFGRVHETWSDAGQRYVSTARFVLCELLTTTTSVKTRLDQGDGMSFAEFSYPLLQAWDWWTLFHRNGMQVQVGGSDQYGNILFGMDAVKSISRNTAIEIKRNPLESELDRPIGFTTPLLTTPSGEKFGKSAGNAIWLDKDMTSTFELYQASIVFMICQWRC